MSSSAPIQRILIPIDFSATSRDAAAFGFKLARQLGAEAVCTTVIDVLDLPPSFRAVAIECQTDEELMTKLRAWMAGEFAAITAGAGLDVKFDERRGVPEDEILNAIRELGPDFVVMGSNGITRQFAIGSRAHAILKESSVPVLIVRPHASEA